jgi:hypothetical protein
MAYVPGRRLAELAIGLLACIPWLNSMVSLTDEILAVCKNK